MIETVQARLAPYVSALRRKGPRHILAELYDLNVNHRLMRKVVYPTLGEWHLAQLRRDNERRRAKLRSAAARPATGRVFVVICIDTEGPNALGESHDWPALEAEVRAFSEPTFRRTLADKQGRSFSVDWFVVDWLGPGPDRRRLTRGYHGVLDRYLPLIENARALGHEDAIHWHYHHVPKDSFTGFNRDWLVAPRYEEILSRRLLERNMFPAIYRAGNTWEDNACSNWLERFIPFDLSNRGPHKSIHYDWARAPRTWTLYHPDAADFQRPGGQRRLMGRSLDVEKNWFRPEEVEQAFLDALEGRDSYVSFYVHDFNALRRSTTGAVETVRTVAAAYPEVEWLHLDALGLFRRFGNVQPNGRFTLDAELQDGELTVAVSHTCFGEPWLAVEVADQVIRLDMERVAPLRFRARLPSTPSPRRIGVAANDFSGQTSVLRL